MPLSPPNGEGQFALVARATRGAETESWHFAAAAVARPGGELIAQLGDPQLAIWLRSSAKPFQALPLVAGGGVERFALAAADLGLICASHSGGPEHAERAAELLARGGYSAGDLLCGAHLPLGGPEAAALARTGAAPTPLHNNCSGKHAGMLLTCRLLGLPSADYIAFDHPLQAAIREQFGEVAGLRVAERRSARDGCSAPTFHLPLAAGARAYAALAEPRAAGLDGVTAAALETIAAGMAAAPEMVAGRGRFTTALIRETGGRVIGKEGAEGVYGIAIRAPVAMGVLLKIADGGERARDTVVLDLVRQLGALSAEEMSRLGSFYRPALRNHRGFAIGEIVGEVELNEA